MTRPAATSGARQAPALQAAFHAAEQPDDALVAAPLGARWGAIIGRHQATSSRLNRSISDI